jgi:hypothetical protein
METETELKALDGKTGTEKMFFLPFCNEIANAETVAEYRTRVSARNLKKFDAAIVPVTLSWVWSFGYRRDGTAVVYRTREVTTRDDTGERLGN